jgi:Domain of unknown function (DUF5666)
MRMIRILLGATILVRFCLQAQVAASPVSDADNVQALSAADQHSDDRPLPRDKVGLVRGVLKQLDPIHDQLLIHAFGGRDIRIAFDGRTQLLPGNGPVRSAGIAAGSVVSVDTVLENGRLFARTVRKGTSNGAELNGQVVRYDAAKDLLTLHDRINPEDVSMRVTASTAITSQGKSASAESLIPGMLVRVWFSAQDRAERVEILAKPGSSFTFQGRIVAIDLRSRNLSLSNDTDQSVHELTFGSLDANALGVLREGAYVNIQAEFDGDRYNIRAVTPVSRQ